MNTVRSRIETTEIALSGGRILRVWTSRTEGGDLERFGAWIGWQNDTNCQYEGASQGGRIVLPAEALESVQEALRTLSVRNS